MSLVLTSLSAGQEISAQLNDSLFAADYGIDPLQKGKLAIEIDNTSFFKNNEFVTTVQKGYTLPGFQLQLKASYYPLHNLKIEGGAHSIWFWGTTRYPAFAYKDMAKWEGQDYAHNVHVLPYFRANVKFSESVNFIFGNIFGGANHRLIEPLYNHELNLSSDPESGIQLLCNTKWINFDLWLDWITYIYELDTHQESFVSGVSTRFLANSPKSPFHVYFPVQGLVQHRGGEIDLYVEEVQTVMNGAAGAGLTWNPNLRVLKYINTEFDIAGYMLNNNALSDLNRGSGYYAKLSLQLQEFNVTASYWRCKDFMTVFGSPFYGSVSTKIEGLKYKRPQLFYLSADYVHQLGKGFVFGVEAEAYFSFGGSAVMSDGGLYQGSVYGGNTNYSFGVYLRMSPSFLIKQY
ncbi:MAG: hypothetical protein LBT42_01010 [Tannerella sp.]|nr:hypothetical protein [Tannerella sp.]